MKDDLQNPDQRAIWATIGALNAAWTQGRPEELSRYFHPQMIAVTPSERVRLAGAGACIAAWKTFADQAKIRYWREIEPLIRVYGEAAVVSYYYEMSCAIAHREVQFSGRDLFFLIRENDRWWVVADQFSNYPE